MKLNKLHHKKLFSWENFLTTISLLVLFSSSSFANSYDCANDCAGRQLIAQLKSESDVIKENRANSKRLCEAQKRTCHSQCNALSNIKEEGLLINRSPRDKCHTECTFIDCN